jgi:hypothetical protein
MSNSKANGPCAEATILPGFKTLDPMAYGDVVLVRQRPSPSRVPCPPRRPGRVGGDGRSCLVDKILPNLTVCSGVSRPMIRGARINLWTVRPLVQSRTQPGSQNPGSWLVG